MLKSSLARGIFTLAIGVVIWFCPMPDGLDPKAWHIFAIAVATIVGFILTPLPMGAMAIAGLTVAALTKTLSIGEALSGFGSTAIWLIVCAFLFARGFSNTGLGRRLAFLIMRAIGSSSLKLGYALAITDLILSPATPSSAARAGGILFPIVRGLCTAFDSEPGPSARKIGAYLMQLVYQIEGVVCAMFMTSMAGNPLMVELAAKTLNIELSWGQWLLASCLPGMVAMIAVPYILYLFYPPELKKTPEAPLYAAAELEKMGPMSLSEKLLSLIFICALILWCTSLNATLVAFMAVVAMLATRVLEWKEMTSETGAWDTLIWMGGLITLADMMSRKGFIPWFSKMIAASMSGIDWTYALVALILIYMYSHYAFASLTAHIGAMYAAFIAVAAAAGTPPYLAALAMAFTANICLSLTTYSGSPGPIYFGAGYVPQSTWWKLGFYFSIVNIVIWVGLGAVWWKVVGMW
ncbi:MAG: anion permease [Desulfovibrio sp.]|jgi:DASS family divalent anion:Na+ symporter|nr:anion permease [Desulfovibrio sp.]